MLGFLRKWRANRNRRIFRFWDGTQFRRMDPLEIMSAIETDPEFNPAVHCELVDAGDRDSTLILVNMVSRAFQVPAFDGTAGLTIRERIDLYQEFGTWVGALKKNIASKLNSLPSSDLERAFPKSNAATISVIAESSSTSPSSNGVAPTQ